MFPLYLNVCYGATINYLSASEFTSLSVNTSIFLFNLCILAAHMIVPYLLLWTLLMIVRQYLLTEYKKDEPRDIYETRYNRLSGELILIAELLNPFSSIIAYLCCALWLYERF